MDVEDSRERWRNVAIENERRYQAVKEERDRLARKLTMVRETVERKGAFSLCTEGVLLTHIGGIVDADVGERDVD